MVHINIAIKSVKLSEGSIIYSTAGSTARTEVKILSFLHTDTEFSAAYRYNSFLIKMKNGCIGKGNIPRETQFLLVKNNEEYMMFYALADKTVRTSLYSDGKSLYAVMETADSAVTVNEEAAVYIITGEDPYRMAETAAKEIQNELQSFNLLKEKVVPKFADMLGLCTYNAFYDDVSEEKILYLLKKFEENNISLGYLIMDAGWQKTINNRLAAFEADNNKFPNGLKATIGHIKKQFGVKEVLLWHTYNGFWSGVEKNNFPSFSVDEKYFNQGDKAAAQQASGSFNQTVGEEFYPGNLKNEKCGFINTDFFRFYYEYYSHMKKQGADGVKLDAMAWIEAFSEGRGGRVAMTRQMVSGLEGASLIHFGGETINCSSCTNDFFYNSLKNGVVRASSDYMPDDDHSVGEHIYTNAFVSFWIGDLFVTDWDMFQSGNFGGEFHAMARAVSGGPVYCSDNMEKVDYRILSKLTCGDGKICRCETSAKISRDCLFTDYSAENKIIKIFNRNKHGYVIGVFNYNNIAGKKAGGSIKIGDIEGIDTSKQYAVYSYQNGFIGKWKKGRQEQVALERFQADIYSFAEIQDGVAVFGLTDKYNSLGFIKSIERSSGGITIKTACKGRLCVYSEKKIDTGTHSVSRDGDFYCIDADKKTVTLLF